MRSVRRWLSLAAIALASGVGAAAGRAQAPVAQAGKANALPSGYAGSGECTTCHRVAAAQFAATFKGKLFLQHPRDEREALGCESCHGPAKQHVQTGGEERGALVVFGKKNPSPVAVRNEQCLSCHAKTARTLWRGSPHEARNVACTDCHSVMHAGTERGNLAKASVMQTCAQCHKQKVDQLTRFSHMPIADGKLECSTCHNPHGSPNEKLLLASSVNQTCYTCHADKRGPFLYEHAPVVENCANCHDPHGSNKEKLLKVSRPRLCQQCHPTAHGFTTAKPADLATSRFVYNKGCVNCHVNLHGSNHPAGAFFTR
jgi:DmsE family decaheme c-type cytochrome